MLFRSNLYFGETVGRRRWLAIALGMIGVLLILRPSTAGVSLTLLCAVVGVLGFAGRDLASRAAPKSLSAVVLGLYGFLTVFIAGLVVSAWQWRTFSAPDAISCFLVLAASSVGVFAYAALMKAMRTGAISAVTPFRYSRMLFGLALSLIVFDEKLDVTSILGCCVILVAGGMIISSQAPGRTRAS